jgi:hypothetical protein
MRVKESNTCLYIKDPTSLSEFQTLLKLVTGQSRYEREREREEAREEINARIERRHRKQMERG